LKGQVEADSGRSTTKDRRCRAAIITHDNVHVTSPLEQSTKTPALDLIHGHRESKSITTIVVNTTGLESM